MRTSLPVLILLAAVPAAAQLPNSALGAAGELYVAKAGTYGDLFPASDAHDASTPVLALEIAPAGEQPSRSLVPGTADARVEAQPALIYEQRSDSIILMWQSRGPGGKLRIDFATRGGDGWSSTQTVTDSDGLVVRLDDPPLTAITDDAFDLALTDEEILSTTRLVIHLLYRFADSVWYTPLFFVEGAHVGWIESLDLGRSYFRTPAEVDTAPAPLADNLAQIHSLEVTDGEGSVVAAFANSGSGRLGTVEIRLLPLSIELLGDYVRDRILAEAELYDPADVSTFSDIIRAEIIATGLHMDLHPGIVEFASDRVGDWLESSAADYGYAGFENLGDDARELAIYLTGSVSAALVEDPTTSDEILEINLGDFLAALDDDSVLSQLLDIQVRADRAAPEIGEGLAVIFPSRDGRDLLIGWKPDDGAIRYVESRGNAAGGAWSDVRSLTFGDRLTLAQAIELLQQKIH